ncbi:FCS-Like Zinc finger 10 [Cardamine amara subsp. amara]|uniref:FCS-Like Zinc finger 10 n=1 Tax=Cardamine amara subsp. amara TaxID=228776 RepID=A0ABD1A5Z3_CARAN
MSHHFNNQMISSVSDYYSTKPDLSGLKNHRLISASGVVEAKSPSDYESAWSPTSPLDFRFFSSFGNPFAGSSSRSIWKGEQKSWDSGKVGLSILHSLADDHRHHQTDSSRILLPSPDSKNMIFGSLMRNGNLNCQKPLLSQAPAKAFIPNTDVPKVVFGIGHNPFDVVELQSSCLVDTYCVNNNAFNGLADSDIEMSEDYTCVTSHGPNPKTTHIFGDQVLESAELNELKKLCCGKKKESIFDIAPLDLTTTPIDVYHPKNFLRTCYLCSKKLDFKEDIYMYSGYKAFCSSECRQVVLDLDEEMNEEEEEDDEAMSTSSSDEDLSKKKSNGVIFTMG